MAPPAPGKLSPVTVGAAVAPGYIQQQQASMLRTAAVVMDDNDDFSNATDLCNQYRHILKQHVSLQAMMSANHIHDDNDDGGDDNEDDDDISLGSSCYMLHNDHDEAKDKDGDDLDGNVSRCEADSLSGSFLSGIDSVKIIRRRKISNHEQQHQEQDKANSDSVSSVLEDLDDMLIVDTTNTTGKDIHNETASQASSSSSSSVYSFDLDFMISEQS